MATNPATAATAPSAATTSKEAQQEAKKHILLTIQERDRTIEELKNAAETQRKQHDMILSQLKELEFSRDHFADEVRDMNAKYDELSTKHTALTREHGINASFKGWFRVLVILADDALDDGEDMASEVLDMSTLGQRIASALEQLRTYRQQLTGGLDTDQAARIQNEVTKAAAALAKVRILETSLENARNRGDARATQLGVEKDALEAANKEKRATDLANGMLQYKLKTATQKVVQQNIDICQYQQQIKTLERQIAQDANRLNSEKNARQTSSKKLQIVKVSAERLRSQLDTVARRLGLLVFDGIWEPECDSIETSKHIYWSTLKAESESAVDGVFPVRETPLPESTFAWTLGMCTRLDMELHLDNGFRQLLIKLTIVLPLHPSSEAALAIVEGMLRQICDSSLADLFELQHLLMASWSSPDYARTDDRDLVECRIMELILRGAHYHGRRWATLHRFLQKWSEKLRSTSQQSLVILAYMAWVNSVMSFDMDSGDQIYSVLQLLLEEVPQNIVTSMRSKAIFGDMRTREEVSENSSASSRVLLAGKLFHRIRAYILFDPNRQEAILFRGQGNCFVVRERMLKLPSECYVVIPGLHDTMTGEFDKPKLFIGDLYFVLYNMPDLYVDYST